jgi:hypothetical protein
MAGESEQPRGQGKGTDKDLDLEAVREVEAAVTRLAQRFAQRDQKVSAALQHEVHVLRDLLEGKTQSGGGVRGSLHRLRELYDSVLVSGLTEETRDASLLILLNRLLGV